MKKAFENSFGYPIVYHNVIGKWVLLCSTQYKRPVGTEFRF